MEPDALAAKANCTLFGGVPFRASAFSRSRHENANGQGYWPLIVVVPRTASTFYSS
jgi:hypothetical protein